MAEKNLLKGFTITTPDSYQIRGMFFSPLSVSMITGDRDSMNT